jgi:multidrug efflux pump subunit AcrB
LAWSLASLIICVTAVATGIVPFSFFPKLEGNVVTASARLPYGTPIERTLEVRRALEAAANAAIEQSGGPSVTTGIFTSVGELRGGGHGGGVIASGSHVVSVEINLVGAEERAFSSLEFEQRWREHLPQLAGVEALSIGGTGGPSAGRAVDVQLSHRSTEVLAHASERLTEELGRYASLTNVENSYSSGKPRLDFTLKPEARTLGLTSTDVARTLRASFFGEQALREQRGRNELKVMVRLVESERTSEQDIVDLVVGTPNGSFVPISTVADFQRTRAPTEIKREDGRRTVNVSAELGKGANSPRPVLESLEQEVLPHLSGRYPGLQAKLVGQQREREESLGSLGPMYVLALLTMFALLAIPFRSYVQPLIVMSAIPFGLLGAVLGHVLMGYQLSFISLLGMVALSGVVVNDSLVLVDAVNRYRASGMPVRDALIAGATRRLRPILLTSLTTFFGLMPMIFETSIQAKFLIPMAISLGFGALFVTVIVLLVVPCLYLVVEKLRGEPAPEAVAVDEPIAAKTAST